MACLTNVGITALMMAETRIITMAKIVLTIIVAISGILETIVEAGVIISGIMDDVQTEIIVPYTLHKTNRQRKS